MTAIRAVAAVALVAWLASLAAVLAACGQDGTQSLPPASTGTVAVEIIDTAQVVLQPTPDGAFDVSLAFQSDYGLFDPSSTLTAHGRIEAYPEADMVAYTARLAAPAYPQGGGACGASPVSLAMTLTRRSGNAHVGGGVAVYCGAATYSGAPQRILRLQGDVPLPQPSPAR
jgi:hypothetical protein